MGEFYKKSDNNMEGFKTLEKVINIKESRKNDLVIREATPDDVDNFMAIKKQVHDFYVEKRPDIYEKNEVLYTETFLNSFFQGEERVILLGLLDDEIIAYSFLELLNVQLPMMVERKYVYIHDFAVSKNHRHQGIATKMMEYIELHAISHGIFKIELAVHLFSEDAICLYEKRGFKPRAMRMEKELEL